MSTPPLAPPTPSSDQVVAHNRYAWNWAARNGNRWSIPVSEEVIARARQGDLEIVLTPAKNIPKEWLGNLDGKSILGLASGGGQQGPVLAAAGADVTILDLSTAQLEQDAKCAETFGLSIRTVEAQASDLSAFPDHYFDLVINPVSNCFFPELAPVWSECARVLKPGGILLYAFCNPINFLFDREKANQNEFHLKYKIPYADHTSLSHAEQARFIYPEAPIEFSHSLTDQMAALMKCGFVIEDMYEDGWDTAEGLNNHYQSFIAIKARRLSVSAP